MIKGPKGVCQLTVNSCGNLTGSGRRVLEPEVQARSQGLEGEYRDLRCLQEASLAEEQ